MAEAAAETTQQTPQVLGGIVPYLSVDGAGKAAAFYERAFGAKEVARHPEDEQGRTMHIHLQINGGSLMLSDAFPEHGHPLQAPQAFSLLLPVEDIDSWWNRAVESGAEIVMPLQLMFWGDRYGQLRDNFGVLWAFNGSREAT
jgi:PhnB protein